MTCRLYDKRFYCKTRANVAPILLHKAKYKIEIHNLGCLHLTYDESNFILTHTAGDSLPSIPSSRSTRITIPTHSIRNTKWLLQCFHGTHYKNKPQSSQVNSAIHPQNSCLVALQSTKSHYPPKQSPTN